MRSIQWDYHIMFICVASYEKYERSVRCRQAAVQCKTKYKVDNLSCSETNDSLAVVCLPGVVAGTPLTAQCTVLSIERKKNTRKNKYIQKDSTKAIKLFFGSSSNFILNRNGSERVDDLI